MKIGWARTEGCMLLEVRGGVTPEDAPALACALDSIDTSGARCLVIHFDEAGHLQPEVLGALFALLHRLPREGALDVIAECGRLRRHLQALGLSGRRGVRVLARGEEVFAA